MLDNFADSSQGLRDTVRTPPPTSDIWQVSETVSRRLLAWNILNVTSGVIATLVAGKNHRLRGIGGQALGWGAINIAIAVFGRNATRKRAAQPNARMPYQLHKEARNLRWLLWLNTGLDVLYILGGSRFARRAKGETPSAELQRGSGFGIMLQGAFLFIFDLIHVFRVPRHTR